MFELQQVAFQQGVTKEEAAKMTRESFEILATVAQFSSIQSEKLLSSFLLYFKICSTS
jgi:hypothetical protein